MPVGIISGTNNASVYSRVYPNVRQMAWRNLLVAAANARIEQGLFGLGPGQNFWPGFRADDLQSERHHFDFMFPDGRPCIAAIYDAGWDELRIQAVYAPSKDGKRWLGVCNAGFRAGEAIASSWIERQKGTFLQSCPEQFRYRSGVAPVLASVQIEPIGYSDHGVAARDEWQRIVGAGGSGEWGTA